MRDLNPWNFICISLLLLACSSPTNQPTIESSTSGQVTVSVDESFVPVFEVLDYTYESLNPEAKITIAKIPQGKLVAELANDSCKVIVMGRDLSEDEKKMFASHNLYPTSIKIAEHAVAVITNNNNSIHSLSVHQLKRLFQKESNGNTSLVFDNANSSVTLYIKDSLLNGAAFSENVFALHSTEELIEYVQSHNNAIGFIGYNWISDMDAKFVKETLKKIKVIAISNDSTNKAYLPCQATIKTKEYPLINSIYMINRQQQIALGTGFVNFVSGEKGQLIVLKSGLIPAYPPQRLIKTAN